MKHKVEAAHLDSTKVKSLPLKEVLVLLNQIDEIYATKGQNVIHLDLRRDQPDETTLAELLIGRTGNLRAPALRRGRTLMVGFNDEMYKQFFK